MKEKKKSHRLANPGLFAFEQFFCLLFWRFFFEYFKVPCDGENCQKGFCFESYFFLILFRKYVIIPRKLLYYKVYPADSKEAKEERRNGEKNTIGNWFQRVASQLISNSYCSEELTVFFFSFLCVDRGNGFTLF